MENPPLLGAPACQVRNAAAYAKFLHCKVTSRKTYVVLS